MEARRKRIRTGRDGGRGRVAAVSCHRWNSRAYPNWSIATNSIQHAYQTNRGRMNCPSAACNVLSGQLQMGGVAVEMEAREG